MNLQKIVFAVLLACFIFISPSCFKHRRQIRVKNTFAVALKVVVGPADFGAVPSVKTTDYKDIPKGKLDITGDIGGSITVPSGKHKYTLSINTAGIVTLIEDTN